MFPGERSSTPDPRGYTETGSVCSVRCTSDVSSLPGPRPVRVPRVGHTGVDTCRHGSPGREEGGLRNFL